VGESEAVADEHLTLDLHGANAPAGINLDDLERFVKAFRAALRQHQVDRGGEASGVAFAESRHRLGELRMVSLRAGSAVIELADPLPEAEATSRAAELDAPSVAFENAVDLTASIGRDEVSPGVAAELDRARRALGRDGRFGVAIAGRVDRVQVDEARVARWTLPSARPPQPVRRVVGRLHGLETEGTPRFMVRGQDGADWACQYEPELEPDLLASVRRLVVIDGSGERNGTRGSIEIERLTVVEEPSPAPMLLVPETADLRSGPDVARPQGLEALAVDGITDDERAAFLSAIFDA
jgi:hypothetical protein